MTRPSLRHLLYGIGVAVTAVSAISTGLVTARVDGTAAPRTYPALPVETQAIVLQPGFAMRHVFSGQVEARRDSVLGFETGGRLAQVHVEEGAHVAQGALLAELDRERLETQRAELGAALNKAEAGLALATATQRRLEQVVEAGGVSRQGLDEAREGRRAAEAALQLARRRIASLDVELAKTRLYAPFAGTVITRLADEGRVLNSGGPVLQLQELAAPEIRVGVAGRTVDRLVPGEIHRLEWRGRPLAARLRTLLPRRAASARTVDALFEPLDADLNLLPGDIVTLALDRQVEQPGTWLPIGALTEGERGLWSVYVTEPADSGTAAAPAGLDATHRLARRSVDVIYQEADRVYVRGAVAQGERVVTTGLQRIVPGQWVRDEPTLIAQQAYRHD